MYNLIVGATDGLLPADRLLESVEGTLVDLVGPPGARNIGRVLNQPTLLMPEVNDDRYPQRAEVGSVVGINKVGRNYQFYFVRNTAITPIPSETIKTLAMHLHLEEWDLRRTRWSVRDADLYRVLLEDRLMGTPSPTVFNIPKDPPEAGRVAVMMPFSAEFDPVWDTLKATAAEGGWICQRADDIWEDNVVINDVVSLIARSKVVICDLTHRNSNVFYEAGIAHTIGREVVLIAQSKHDIPFDLTHYRHVLYYPNSEGLLQLKAALSQRLRGLMAS